MVIINKRAPSKKLRMKNRSSLRFSIELSDVQGRDRTWALARCTNEEAHWLTFKQLRNKCTSSLRKAKASSHIELVSSSLTNPSKFWKAVTANKSNPLHLFLHISLSNNCVIDKAEQICYAFNTYFAAAGNQFDILHFGSASTGQPLPHVPSSDPTSQFRLQAFPSPAAHKQLRRMNSVHTF